MKWLIIIYAIVILAIGASAKSPSGGYAPGKAKCPSKKSLLREAKSISSEEKKWLKERQKKTNQALITYLDNANLTDFDAEGFLGQNTSLSVNIGLAFSGGGYRAMLVGAGQLAALDNRTENADTHGLGGILQSSSYISALSGGAWLLGSLAMQEWPSVQDVVMHNPNDLWNLTFSRQLVNQTSLLGLSVPLLTANLSEALTHLNHWQDDDGKGIGYDLISKSEAGFNTTLTDAWARALAYQLSTEGKDDYGSSATFSDIRDKKSFANHEMPFPILNALARQPDSILYDENSTVIEFNPYEMGSFDSSINSFTDIKYLGTNVNNGVPVNGTCIEGFDNAGFIMGTSSSLFNQFLNTLACDDCTTLNFLLKPLVKRVLTKLSRSYEDNGLYKPNPFYRSEHATPGKLIKNESLYLIDGGLGGQTIPLATMMTKERAMDAVFAFDNDAWSNGSSLVATYARQFSNHGKSQICPYVPDEQNFLYQNLTAKPTFFGCDASNMTDLVKDGVIPPVVIYIANRPFEYMTNTSTFKMMYTDKEKKAMVQNGFDTATRANMTIDEEWAACVGCAVIRREQERRGLEQSDQCKKCFKDYCWNGDRVIFDRTYYTPVNFTMTGKTNGSMDVDTIRDPDLLTGVSSLLKKRDTGDVPMLLSPEEDDDHTEKIVPIIP